MRYLKYTTHPNDRWDLIAYRAYGNSYAYEGIIAANRAVAILPVLPEGIELAIPIIESSDVSQLTLPPWKRAD